MEFGNNQIVKLRNGKIGVVVSFNNKPSHVVFQAFCNPITKFNDNMEQTNHEYDVMEIYDGNGLSVITDVWKKKFDISQYPLIWSRQ